MLIALLAALTLSAQPPEPAPTPSPTPEPVRIAPTKDVRKAARKAGFGELADRLVRASRDAALVGAGKAAAAPAELGTSRYGGDPDLPVGTRWPRCKGKSQSFLGQIRLSDLPPELKELRRLGGTLLVFSHVEFEEPDYTEYGLWAGDCSKVVHAKPGAPLQRVARPKRTLDIVASPMRFRARPDIPDTTFDRVLMPPLEAITIADEDVEQYWELRWALLGKSRDDQLLGYSGQPNGGDDCSARAERPKDTWRHLFTFMNWEVADGGRLQLLISPKDLRRGRFDRVCGTFDSA